MDGIEFILTAILVSIYILAGSFLAWLIGVDPITLPWFSVVVLWPALCCLGVVVAMFIWALVVSMLDAIFGGLRHRRTGE